MVYLEAMFALADDELLGLAFLGCQKGGGGDPRAMAREVDARLYRQRPILVE